MGRVSENLDNYQGQYHGATRTQIINQAGAISLPATTQVPKEIPTAGGTNHRPAISLDLPSAEADAGQLNQIPR